MASEVSTSRHAHAHGVPRPPAPSHPDVGLAAPPEADGPAAIASVVLATDSEATGMRIGADYGSTSRAPLIGKATAGGLGTRLLAVDLVLLLISFAVVSFQLSNSHTLARRLAPGVIGAAAAMGAMDVLGLYRSRYCARIGSHAWRLVLANIAGGTVLMVLELLTGPPRWDVALCTGAAIAATGTGRWEYGRFLRARRASGRYLRPVLLIGSNADAAYLRTVLSSEPELGYTVVGVVAGEEIEPSLCELPVTRTVSEIPNLASSTRASGVFIVPYSLSSRAVQDAISIAADAGLHIQLWPGIRGIGDARLRSMPLSGEALFYVEPLRSARWQLVTKRGIDIVGSVIGLLCGAPLLAIAAILVKLEDRGSIFYRGERIGLHGKSIFPLKLRTMVVGDKVPDSIELINERTDGPLFKSSVDPRVTRVGRFLRASSIDELPQLWNVLKGTMSLVGPRPALPTESAEFDPEFQRRHSVRPGMSGLWQVEARLNPSFNAYRRLDLRYVDNWSLRLDLRILLATIPAVVSQAWRAMRGKRRR